MPLSIGQQLKDARLDRNLSLEDVFKDIHIRIKYLEALEADDYSMMPSPVQGRGFLRLYAQFLQLDVDKILAEIQDREIEESAFAKVETIDGSVEDAPDLSIADETEGKTPLWQQLRNRVSGTRARPEPAPAQEAESAPIAEASPTSASVPHPNSPDPDRVPRPKPPLTPDSHPDPKKPEVVHDYVQPEPPQPLGEARILFAEIGATLRERREMLSLTYEEIEGHIHLRPHYLASLEAGDFDALPSPVQTRGMLSNYADFLDLETEKLLLKFAEGLQSQRIERHLDVPDADADKRKRRRFSLGGFVAPDLIFGGSVIVLMVAFAVWGLGRIANSRAEDAALEATAPSIAEVLMSTTTPEVTQAVTPTQVIVNTPGGEAGTAAPFEENLDEGANRVQILITVLERSWLRVYVDGEIVFEGRAQPDATFVYEGNEYIEVLTANGAGVRIGYNQRDLGLMGGFGEVVQRLYGPRGLLTPTVTPTQDVTATPSPTLTPSPTRTPTLDTPNLE